MEYHKHKGPIVDGHFLPFIFWVKERNGEQHKACLHCGSSFIPGQLVVEQYEHKSFGGTIH
jgi:hypothetical protein